MIFVCVGSREYQFNRLLKKIDELVEKKLITDYIFAQIGQSTYIPQNYKYERFMSSDKFKRYQLDSDLIISHSGTGALIGALKKGKKVIAVPRLAKYEEHIDDHQIQISEMLFKEGYLKYVLDMDNLLKEINIAKENPISKRYEKSSAIIDVIENFIDKTKQK
ncbi:MAG: PssE/Cps14G family polysaccharide biosynthesis glycosyltransferase [Senegalia sp. (in: firmicutes)]|uniref:PssE/Cps14G family polysaccharide biosynthesis glycosyltransferase n=1 Tax=Senegalia sp. (in: firmicutes) TaxID=1924098 RepID=UPI003F9A60F1